MNRKSGWWVAFGLVSLLCGILLVWDRNPGPIAGDTDTAFIIHEMNRVNDPWRWFSHDWPLLNHFYRPLSTLTFEFDNRVYGSNPHGWVFTLALLAVLSTVALFWFMRELTDSPALSFAATLAFFVWETSKGELVAGWLFYGICALGVTGLWLLRRRPGLFRSMDRAITIYIRRGRPPPGRVPGIVLRIVGWANKKAWRRYQPLILAVLLWIWVFQETPGAGQSPGNAGLAVRILEWIPGRTASLTTGLALLGLAAFTRYLRLSPRRQGRPTALDVPNTRNSSPSKPPSVLWPLIACLAEGLALMSYEQAVVVPALFGMLAIFWWFRGTTVRWAWGIPFGILLVAYLVVRKEFVPQGHSWYYDWQKRSLATTLLFLQRYLFVFWPPLKRLKDLAASSPVMLFISLGPAALVVDTVAAATALYQARRRWFLAGVGWVGSSIAYAPMAPFKDFEHYHYLPEAIRSIFYVMLAWIAFDLTVTAFAPRARQAPRRLSPAPGSLPRP